MTPPSDIVDPSHKKRSPNRQDRNATKVLYRTPSEPTMSGPKKKANTPPPASTALIDSRFTPGKERKSVQEKSLNPATIAAENERNTRERRRFLYRMRLFWRTFTRPRKSNIFMYSLSSGSFLDIDRMRYLLDLLDIRIKISKYIHQDIK